MFRPRPARQLATRLRPSSRPSGTHHLSSSSHSPSLHSLQPNDRPPTALTKRLSSSTTTATTTTTIASLPPFRPSAPTANRPPLSRAPNRPLPTLSASLQTRHRYTTLPLFLLILAGSSLAIFNYQKSSSATLASVLYSLRTNAVARQELGDGIYFASRVPWIRGEVNTLRGRVDVRFWVKGGRGAGEVRFVSVRAERGGNFETRVWELTVPGTAGEAERVWDLLAGEGIGRELEGGVGDGRLAAP